MKWLLWIGLLIGGIVFIFFLASIGGCSSPATAVTTKPTATVDPVALLKTQLDNQRSDYTKLQTADATLKTQYDALIKERDTLKSSNTALQVQVAQLTEQVKNLNASLSTMTTNAQNNALRASTAEQNAAKFMAANASQVQVVNTAVSNLDTFNSRLNTIQSKADATVNGYSDADKAIFYKIWDAWWATWH